jgi:hypothetical protein
MRAIRVLRAKKRKIIHTTPTITILGIIKVMSIVIISLIRDIIFSSGITRRGLSLDGVSGGITIRFGGIDIGGGIGTGIGGIDTIHIFISRDGIITRGGIGLRL